MELLLAWDGGGGVSTWSVHPSTKETQKKFEGFKERKYINLFFRIAIFK